MADEDEINLDDNGSSSSEKKGGLGGVFSSLLKWIIILGLKQFLYVYFG